MKSTCDISLKPFLTEEEATLFCNCSRDRLREARNKAELTYQRSFGKISYRREDLLKFIENNTEYYRSASEQIKRKK